MASLTTFLLCLCAFVHGSLVDDIVNAIENAASCATCHALLVPLEGVALLGDSAFTDTFVEVCEALGVCALQLHLKPDNPCMNM